MWQMTNQPQYDFNLSFSSHNAAKLHASLAKEEKDNFLVLWTPETANWTRYINTMLAAIYWRYFKMPIDPTVTPHDFKPRSGSVTKRFEVQKKEQKAASFNYFTVTIIMMLTMINLFGLVHALH